MKFVLLVSLLVSFQVRASEIKVPGGLYEPVFREPGEADTVVGPLLVDKTPVTNKEFLKFINQRPQYSKSKILRLFANIGYLSHWSGNAFFDEELSNHPITNVSWFVARKYCEAQGKRLPTIAEWEHISDARNDKHEQQILAWYAKPKSDLRNVGLGKPNKYGLQDIHGHIWEWVENFSEIMMSEDARGGAGAAALYCGGAALNAKDPTKYAAFLRFAFRSSLDAKYTSKNLGFRCVKDAKDEAQ